MAIKCLECGHLHKWLPVVCEGCGNGDPGRYERVPDEIDLVKHEEERKRLEALKK